MTARHLDPGIEASIALGLIPRDIAEEFDDWSDDIAARVVAGSLSVEESEVLTRDRAVKDEARAQLRGFPMGVAALLGQVQPMTTEQFTTVPWAPGMEERQMTGQSWAYVAERKSLIRFACAVSGVDPQNFRWGVVMDLAQSAAKGEHPNAADVLMLGLGLLDVPPCTLPCCQAGQ